MSVNPIREKKFYFWYGPKAIERLEKELEGIPEKILKEEKRIEEYENYILQLEVKKKNTEWKEDKEIYLELIKLFKKNIIFQKNKLLSIPREIENLKNNSTKDEVDHWFWEKMTKDELKEFISRSKEEEANQLTSEELFEKNCPKEIDIYTLLHYDENPVRCCLDMERLRRVLRFKFFDDLEKGGYKKEALEKCWEDTILELSPPWKYLKIREKKEIEEKTKEVFKKTPKIGIAKKINNWIHINKKPIIYITGIGAITVVAIGSLILVGGIFFLLKIY